MKPGQAPPAESLDAIVDAVLEIPSQQPRDGAHRLVDDALERTTSRMAAELAPVLAAYVRGAAMHEQRLCRRCGLEAGRADAVLGLALRLLNAKTELERLWTLPWDGTEAVGDRSLRFGQELAQLELVLLELRDGGAS